MRSIGRSWIFIFHLVLASVLAATPRAETAIERMDMVAIENNPPFSFSLPDGTQTGLYIEFWRLWSLYTGVPVTFELMSIEDSIKAVESRGKVHVGLFRNRAREEWAAFSAPIHSVKTRVLYRNEYPATVDLSNLDGIRVSAGKGSYQESYLREQFPNLDIVSTSDDDPVSRLLNGELDAIVGEQPYLESMLARSGLTGVLVMSEQELLNNRVHAMVAKGKRALIPLIDQGIGKIPLASLIALEKKWLPNNEPFFRDLVELDFLTVEEKNWLRQHSSFSLGIDTSWYPFDFTDRQGRFSGMAADYVKAFSEKLQISMTPVYGSSWNESFARFQQGEVDIMAAAIATEKRRRTVAFTDPYFSTPTVILTRRNSFYAGSMDDLRGRKLGLVKGFAIVDLVGRDYPGIEIVLVDSIVDGLRKLQRGEIDAYIGALAVINYEINQLQLDGLAVSAFAPYKFEVSMAVRKGLEPLLPILNKLIATMPERERTAIANNWLAVHVQTGVDARAVLLWILPPLLVLIGAIGIVVRGNRALRREIVRRENVEQELIQLAHHDPLTGLPNRRLFEELSEAAIVQAKRNRIRQALLFIDIDGFKDVNDTWGHKTGDHLLIKIGDILHDSVRESDLLARIGGDEFVVHLCSDTDTDDAAAIAAKIIRRLSQPFDIDGHRVHIGASIGIAIYPSHGADIFSLLRYADMAMYTAKSEGKNTYRFFMSPDITDMLER